MRKVIIIFFLMAILLLPISAFAQGEVNLESVLIKLWPEFDQRAVLVIYQIELAQDTPLPATVTANIPASTGGPSAVAMIVENGGLVNADYTVEENGDWLAVQINAETTGLWLEYYDAGITFEGTNRDYDFTWVGSHPVNHLAIELQRPSDVLLITTSPSLGVGVSENDGLTYFRQDFGAMAANETFEISVSYEKTSETYTVDSMSTQGSGSVDAASSPGTVKINWQWVIGIAAVGLIGYGVFAYFGSGRPTKSKRGRRKPGAEKTQSSPLSANSSVFCHSCGTQAFRGDKFCRECGTKLRV